MNDRQKMEWVWPVMAAHGTEPLQGQFVTFLHKSAPERALSIAKIGGLWVVHLDGIPIAGAAADWRTAFGWVYSRYLPGSGDREYERLVPRLFGWRVEFNEYRKIIEKNRVYEREGHDLSEPIDFMRVKIP